MRAVVHLIPRVVPWAYEGAWYMARLTEAEVNFPLSSLYLNTSLWKHAGLQNKSSKYLCGCFVCFKSYRNTYLFYLVKYVVFFLLSAPQSVASLSSISSFTKERFIMHNEKTSKDNNTNIQRKSREQWFRLELRWKIKHRPTSPSAWIFDETCNQSYAGKQLRCMNRRHSQRRKSWNYWLTCVWKYACMCWLMDNDTLYQAHTKVREGIAQWWSVRLPSTRS